MPQALEGVATVGVLYATVRRSFSPGAALISGALMALTPVAVLMFRFNNPDALLVLLLTTLAQFEQYLRDGQIHYYIAGGGGGFGGGGSGSTASKIASWVTSDYTAKTIGGSTMYDLTQPITTSGTSDTSSAAG